MKGIKKTRRSMASRLVAVFSVLLSAFTLTTGCGDTTTAATSQDTESQDSKQIVIGFSQLGAESDWRSANTESMKSTFTADQGYKLLIEDGQQQQANQIMAIRKFIQQDVDYIVLAPVTETGWETVLEEARSANIPVIVIDRQVAVSDPTLFNSWVGSDFELEAKKDQGLAGCGSHLWLESSGGGAGRIYSGKGQGSHEHAAQAV